MFVSREFRWVKALGKPVARTRYSRASIAIVAIGLAFPTLVIGFLLAALLQGPLGLSNLYTELLATVFWTLGFAGLGYLVGKFVGREAVLYERGVALNDGKRVRAWDFDQLTGVAVSRAHVATVNRLHGLKVETQAEEYNYRIYDRAGDSFLLFQWLRDVHRVGEPILEEVTRLVAPGIINAFFAGETATFGSIEIGPDGVQVLKRHLTWEELADLRAENGQVVIEGKDGVRTSVRMIDVINAGVLLSIIDRLRQPLHTDGLPDLRVEAES